MRTGSLVLLALVLLAGCRRAPEASEAFMLPAEWEPHEAVWISFLGFGGPVDSLAFVMVRHVARHTPVRAIFPDNDGASSRMIPFVRARLEASGVDLSRVEVVHADSIVQARDTGPIFVRDRAGAVRIVDFAWNNYGRADAGTPDVYPFDSLMAARFGIPVVRSPLVMEGGALETNGAGTLLQVESVTLQRNPGWSKAEIEAELKRVLGQEQVIWLKEGPAEDPQGLSLITEGYLGTGVGGHVDEFCRFVGPRTVLLAMPDSAEAAADPVKRITYERMRVNQEILQRATDPEGRPFEVVPVPVPDVPYDAFPVDTTWTHPAFRQVLRQNPQLRHGDTLRWVPATSYLNYFVTNGLVLVPQYGAPGMPASVREEDEAFRAVLARYFPDREIVPINPLALNYNGGGIHCWTQQQPAPQ